MQLLLTRFRRVTVLFLVLFAQLVLLAYQVKTGRDVRLIRVWAASAVTPLARLLESARSGAAGFVDGYIRLAGVKEENRRLQAEIGRLTMENRFLRNELGSAERAQALLAFQSRTPSRTVAARVIGTGTGGVSKVVFLDRGSSDGVQPGMAVITPDGIVGRVQAVYPNASQVLLITDVNFAAGVVSQKNRVEGILRGRGGSTCAVDYLQNEQSVDVGEWFFTSGDDRVFPRGLPVGVVTSAVPGPTFKQVLLSPSGLRKGLEEALVVLEGAHTPVPEAPPVARDIQILPAPPADTPRTAIEGIPSGDLRHGTDADRLREHYRRIGEAQGHVFGESLPGARPPDFNLKLPEQARPQGAAAPLAPPPALPAQPSAPVPAPRSP